MAHRLLIIQPSYYRSKADRTVFKVRRRPVVPLTPPYLAALTPPHWLIKLVDEQLEPIDFGFHAVLVAIWPQMPDYAIHGGLKKIYRGELLSSLAGLPVPRYDLLNMRYYRPFTTFAVSSSRGCPFRCEFC